MYDINTKNIKKGKSFPRWFLIGGLFFLIIMLVLYISSVVKLKSLDSSVTSFKVDVNSHIDDEDGTMYSPIYYYEVDGKSYTCNSNYSTNQNPGTENKTVYYDSKNPSNCMTEFSKTGGNILLLCMIFPIIIIVFSVISINKVNKRIKAIKILNQKGKLVKNLPYRLENSGTVVNNVPIQIPVVDYTLPSGSTVTLYGDARYDKKSGDADGMVDLVIDEDNPSNYFIDFEINRLSGNLAQDYYQQAPVNNVAGGDVQSQMFNNQNNNNFQN